MAGHMPLNRNVNKMYFVERGMSGSGTKYDVLSRMFFFLSFYLPFSSLGTRWKVDAYHSSRFYCVFGSWTSAPQIPLESEQYTTKRNINISSIQFSSSKRKKKRRLLVLHMAKHSMLCPVLFDVDANIYWTENLKKENKSPMKKPQIEYRKWKEKTKNESSRR